MKTTVKNRWRTIALIALSMATGCATTVKTGEIGMRTNKVF